MKAVLTAEHGPDGFEVEAQELRSGLLRKTKRQILFPDWDTHDLPRGPVGRTALQRLIQEDEAKPLENGRLCIADEAAANLNAAEARALGLPDPIPFPLEIQTSDHIASDSFKIWSRFIGDSGQPLATNREGAAVRTTKTLYRLPGTLWNIIQAVEAAGEAPKGDDRLSAIAHLLSLLPRESDRDVTADQTLKSIKLYHAHTFTLDLMHDTGELEIDPVPLSSRPVPHGDQIDNDLTDKDALPKPLMSESETVAFQKDFRRLGASEVHVLRSGVYLFIDPALRPVMEVIQAKQVAPMPERTAFAMHPERELVEILGEEEIGGLAPAARFVELSDYSDRVTEIGPWVPPDLPFVKGESSNWLPERFSIILGQALVTLGPEDIPEALASVESAMEAGETSVLIGGVTVPANQEVETELKRLVQIIKPPEIAEDDTTSEPGEPSPGPGINYVGTLTNFYVQDFNRKLKPRSLTKDEKPAMRSTLRLHQVEALEWLKMAYRQGRPGALLADDMGLGKTIEVLSFLSWLRVNSNDKRPFLIVAPTSLLDNWTDEHDAHLALELGIQVTAYGAGLRNLRREKGREYETARSVLDITELQAAGFVLTTYETLRDYQFSFARVNFAVAVYDETQKVKNPKIRMHSATKSINAEFSIAMTGTPVENSMSDLWSIADLVSPGLLPPLRDFVAECTLDNMDNLIKLRASLLESADDGIAPFALRRIKKDVIELPPLTITPCEAVMEDRQASAYQNVVMRGKALGGYERLRALHDMRSISLNPIDPARDPVPDDETYIAASARMRECFKVLDTLASEGTKALVFLNSRKVQDILSDLVRRRYRLERAPLIIRGDTPAGRRQGFVDIFSSGKGFDILILSPRAAGVGLNITAATHVIHLDRWWNPAVEDQCTARAYRIGQEHSVQVHLPMAIHPRLDRDSYDVILNNILDRKRELSQSLFVPSDLTTDDFSKAMEGGGHQHPEIGNGNDGSAGGAPQDDESKLNEIDDRGPIHLENWVLRQCTLNGLNANATELSHDGGADVILRADDGTITHIIQCKHTGKVDSPVDGKIVNDMERAPGNWGVPSAKFVAVTNAEAFAPKVRKYLEHGGAIIIEREDLIDIARLLAKPV